MTNTNRALPFSVEHWPLLLGSVVSAVVVVGTATNAMTWGSVSGGWVYPYFGGLNPKSLLAFALAFPAALALAAFALRQIETRETSTLLICVFGGLLLQAILLWPYPFPLEMVVRSDLANSFYSPGLRYGFAEFLQLSERELATLPFHARHNMPGKVSLYIAFSALTTSSLVMGYLVMAVSSLGGVLLYACVRKLSDRRAALFALFFYLFLPSKLFFFPLLNTVSAVPILLGLWLHLRFLQGASSWDALWLGVVLYGVVFFDPLTLTMGLVFVALMLRALSRSEISISDAFREVAGVTVGFGVVYAVFVFSFEYEIFGRLGLAIDSARAFNLAIGRGYAVWLLNNPPELAIGLGALQATVFVSTLMGAFRGGAGERWLARLAEPAACVAWSLFAVFVFLEILGVNRGEVLRLWIFLASFVPAVTGLYCARTSSLWPFGIVLGLMMLEAAIPLGMIGFVIPGDLLPARGVHP